MNFAFGAMFGLALMFWASVWHLIKWCVNKIHSKFGR